MHTDPRFLEGGQQNAPHARQQSDPETITASDETAPHLAAGMPASRQPEMTTTRGSSWRYRFRGLPNHTRVQKERAMTADKITPKTRQTLTSRPTT